VDSEAVSRSQERMADEFASAVIETSPFREYTLSASVVWWMLLVWAEHAGGQFIETTHPWSRDRLLDFIRAHRDACEALGFTEQTIAEYLP
jgi:hypothetical protein